MSNEMFLVEAAFHINRRKEEAARAALVALTMTRVGILDRRTGAIQAMVAETGRNVDQLTLDELVTCWGWQLLRTSAGNIFGIQLQEDFSSDERRLFEALSPFVTAGSSITLEGKHTGGGWKRRYGFTGSQVVELDAPSPAVPLEKEEGGQGSKTSKKHSKRHYRKTLFWLRAIVAVTMQVLSEGDSEGQEYSVLDRVTIYEQAFAVIAAEIHQGLKPLENNTPDNVDQPISGSQAQEG